MRDSRRDGTPQKNNMPLLETNPIKAALAYMRAAKYQEAANMLRCEFDKAPHRYELGRIANMISPCGMIAEAIDALHRLDGCVQEYNANPPADEDIGAKVSNAVSAFLIGCFLLLGSGCATNAPKHDCVLLKFSHAPSPAVSDQLANTQPDTTTAEVRDWFAGGERGFIISSVHTNEIKAALAEGATASIIHEGGSTLNDFGDFKEKM